MRRSCLRRAGLHPACARPSLFRCTDSFYPAFPVLKKESAKLLETLPLPGDRRHRPSPYHTPLSAPPLIPISSVSGGRPMCHVHTTLSLAPGEGWVGWGGPVVDVFLGGRWRHESGRRVVGGPPIGFPYPYGYVVLEGCCLGAL
eukprot:scaffold117031_cov37-Tisochrysis_lutea.AAC.3